LESRPSEFDIAIGVWWYENLQTRIKRSSKR
jgi:hypothetical protein